MVKLKIDWVRNEEPETKEELRNGSCSKLMTSADNSLISAIENEDIAVGEIDARHEGGDEIVSQDSQLCHSTTL